MALTALNWTVAPSGAALALLDTTTEDGKERQNVTAYQGGATWAVTVSGTVAVTQSGAWTVTGPLTNAELRAAPVPVTTPAASTAGAPAAFTSETSAQMLAANASRIGATIRNDGPGTLAVLLGTGTASAGNATVILYEDDYFELPYGFTGAVQGVFLATGSASVQELT